MTETYMKPKHGWTCFHCGETFHTEGGARDHFGFDPSCDPACRIKLGAERGLLMEFRRLEQELFDARNELHMDSAEGIKAYKSAISRHGKMLRVAEELGYERGYAAALDTMREAQP